MRANSISRINLLREFLTLGFLATAAAVVGIAGGLNSMFNSPSSTPQGSGATATTGAMNTVQPYDMAAYMKMLGMDPSGYVNAGNQAGQQYGQQAQMNAMYQQMLQGQAGTSMGAQQNLMNAGNQMFAAGSDPQQALYQKMLQQTQDQSRASTSMRGIGMSPESAGIENQAVGNFNMDWQNQQLSRMLQGGQGMTQAYNAAGPQGQLVGANLQGASGFGANVPNNTMQSGQVPFQTQQSAYGAPIQAGNAYSTGLNTALNPNLANYNLGAANYGNQQSASGMNALTQGLNQLSNNQPNWMSQMFGGGQNYNSYVGNATQNGFGSAFTNMSDPAYG